MRSVIGSVLAASLFAGPAMRVVPKPLPILQPFPMEYGVGEALDVDTEPLPPGVPPPPPGPGAAHDPDARFHDKVDVYYPTEPTAALATPTDGAAGKGGHNGHPVIFFLHGGGWKTGHSRASHGPLGLYATVGRSLASRGFVVVVANYRKTVGPSILAHAAMAIAAWVAAATLPDGWLPAPPRRRGWVAWAHRRAARWASAAALLLAWYWASFAVRVWSAKGGAVVYPAHTEDVGAALNWTVSSVGAYGGDPDRVVVVGHSAGAHLLSMLLVEPGRLQGALGGDEWAAARVRRSVAGAVLIGTPHSAARMSVNWFTRNAVMYPVFGDDEARWHGQFPVAHCGDPGRLAALRLPPVLLVSAQSEVPECAHPDRDLLPLLTAAGVDARHVVINGTNHFSSVMLIGWQFARAERAVVGEIVDFARRASSRWPPGA